MNSLLLESNLESKDSSKIRIVFAPDSTKTAQSLNAAKALVEPVLPIFYSKFSSTGLFAIHTLICVTASSKNTVLILRFKHARI